LAALIALRTFVEAAIDFPEEEVDFLSDSRVLERLDGIQRLLEDLVASARQGCVLREGLHVVLAGEPNSGKSSLLNALLGTDRAIVSDLPGTTRDTIEQQIHIDGMPLFLIDTAGLRETSDRLMRYVEELDAARERALVIKDDIANQMAEATNKTLYALAVISGIFLPLAFLTGLLGINIGGMPGVEDSRAFWIFCGMIAGLLIAEVFLFRRLKWI